MKYLGIHLTKHVQDVYAENQKMFSFMISINIKTSGDDRMEEDKRKCIIMSTVFLNKLLPTPPPQRIYKQRLSRSFDCFSASTSNPSQNHMVQPNKKEKQSKQHGFQIKIHFSFCQTGAELFLFIRKKLNFLMNTLSALKNVINFLNYLFYNILSLTHFSYKLKLFLLASPGGIYLVTFTHQKINASGTFSSKFTHGNKITKDELFNM